MALQCLPLTKYPTGRCADNSVCNIVAYLENVWQGLQGSKDCLSVFIRDTSWHSHLKACQYIKIVYMVDCAHFQRKT